MLILFLSDKDSWFYETQDRFLEIAKKYGACSRFIYATEDVVECDLMFLVGCSQYLKKEKRNLSHMSLVIHESELPKGRGWSPLSWQILEGASEITVSIIEVEKGIDAGDIFLQKKIKFSGYELVQELRSMQLQCTLDLIDEFLEMYLQGKLTRKKQIGSPTYWPKRYPSDSQLDVNDSISNQFNLLRIVDNERYPAWFDYKGRRYKLRIEESD